MGKAVKKAITKYLQNFLPKWMVYYVFFGDARRSGFPLLRLLSVAMDLKPGFRFKSRKVKSYYHDMECEPPVFIHMPKTGGTSLNMLSPQFPFLAPGHCVIRNQRTDDQVPMGLVPARQRDFRGCYLFFTVRNPLTLLVSYYYHAIGRTSLGPINKSHYDYTNAQRGFEYLVRKILDRTDCWPSRNFLYLQMFNEEGDCVIQWVNRQEHLSQDLDRLAKRFGVEVQINLWERNSGIRDYRTFYSDRMLSELCSHYSREMRLFGYSVMETLEPLITLHPMENHRLRYLYNKDTILFDGSVFSINNALKDLRPC